MKTSTSTPNSIADEIVASLNLLLANEYALYTKTRNANWNVSEDSFYELNKFLECQYELLDVIIDDIADRVRSMGHFALGSLKDFFNLTHLDQHNHNFSNPSEILQSLANDHLVIIQIIISEIIPVADKYKDLGTADFVNAIMVKHEKMTLVLRQQIPETKTVSELNQKEYELKKNIWNTSNYPRNSWFNLCRSTICK